MGDAASLADLPAVSDPASGLRAGAARCSGSSVLQPRTATTYDAVETYIGVQQEGEPTGAGARSALNPKEAIGSAVHRLR